MYKAPKMDKNYCNLQMTRWVLATIANVKLTHCATQTSDDQILQYHMALLGHNHCGLVMPYNTAKFGHHWFR